MKLTFLFQNEKRSFPIKPDRYSCILFLQIMQRKKRKREKHDCDERTHETRFQ